MIKNDFIAKVASQAGVTKADAKDAIDAAFAAIVDAVNEGETVRINGFGTFSKGHRAARMGRNPSTGASVQISASNYLKFKASSTLKQQLN